MSKSKKLQVLCIVLIMTALPILASAAGFHSGKIYLQVESNGEAWYINPTSNNRYYLGRPDDAFAIMRGLGLGITNENLKQIPIGLINISGNDNDLDGLGSDLETAIGTDDNNPDTDGDDFLDKSEVESWNNPNGEGALPVNNALINNLKGRILLQVENNGEAWYLNPNDNKRYFLGRPQSAFEIMRQLGIGITNANLNQIPSSYVKAEKEISEHYSIDYPNSWNFSQNLQHSDAVYNKMTIVHDSLFEFSTGAGYLEILTLESGKDYTLGDFNVSAKTGAEKIYNEDFVLEVKPVKKQKFKYQTLVEYKTETFDKGAKLYADIMINTHKFIHMHMTIFNETDVKLYEDYFNDIIKDLKLVY